MTDIHSLFDLTDRTAIVTGGGGALGSVVAEGLAAAGARVAVIDLRQENAERVSSAIVAGGGQSVGIGADLSSEAAVEQVYAAVDNELGGVDVLVNAVSAAVDRFPAEQFPLAAWNQMLAANLTSYFMCSKAAASRMIAAGRGGSIVNFSSIAGMTALGRGNLAYSTAKGAVVQMTREHAYAWARYGIRVNAVLPCQFVNDWWARQIADPAHSPLVDRALSAIPLGRLGEPHEIVGPVLFLASAAASMVTGIMLPVDGGNLAMNAGASIDW
ncbi:MAG TPA: SDR family oxidoreductase [Streptosporangiaceae bacterium]|nr:SDR family oxidoreductase [Streptosporangiaceae bacterium]